MSLLGFDAIGRLAPAQLSRNAATTTLFVAAPAASTLSGSAVIFRAALIPNTFALGYVGIPAVARIVLPASPNSWQTSGRAVLHSFGVPVSPGDFVASGNSAAALGRVLAIGGACAVSGRSSAFSGVMAVQNAAYRLAASNVGYDRGFEAWFALEKDASSWSGSDEPEAAWRPAPAAVAVHWLDAPSPSYSWSSAPIPTERWKAR